MRCRHWFRRKSGGIRHPTVSYGRISFWGENKMSRGSRKLFCCCVLKYNSAVASLKLAISSPTSSISPNSSIGSSPSSHFLPPLTLNLLLFLGSEKLLAVDEERGGSGLFDGFSPSSASPKSSFPFPPFLNADNADRCGMGKKWTSPLAKARWVR